jgi:hypothetical protein
MASDFLYKQHNIYSHYQIALVKVSREIKGYDLHNIVSIRENEISLLKLHYNEVFKDIASYDNVKEGFVLIDRKKLENYLKSVQLILNFISLELSPVKTLNEFKSKIGDSLPSNSSEDYHPKIFKDRNAFRFFKSLMEEFGNTKQNLANYSFVFHKMTYEGLIHSDLKQKAYYAFLSEFDISIERITPEHKLGKKTFRESIYAKLKVK